MIAVWVVLLVVGLAAAAAASRRAVGAALEITEGLGVSASLVGVSVLAVGTDLPEIANSITASFSGHGDLNVGDSTGSALTQITLVLALLILTARLDLSAQHKRSSVAASAGLMTVGALVLLAAMLSDGVLSNIDGLVLVGGWVITLIALERQDRSSSDSTARPRPDADVGRALLRLMGWLGLVGVSATAMVRSFIEITDILGVPEFIASSIVLALGTSLPELVVDWTAIRRGAAALAIGDLFGSSLVDATLSVGIGPALRATAVSPETVPGVLVIAVGVASATVIMVTARRRPAAAGGLLGVYALSTLALLTLAA